MESLLTETRFAVAGGGAESAAAMLDHAMRLPGLVGPASPRSLAFTEIVKNQEWPFAVDWDRLAESPEISAYAEEAPGGRPQGRRRREPRSSDLARFQKAVADSNRSSKALWDLANYLHFDVQAISDAESIYQELINAGKRVSESRVRLLEIAWRYKRDTAEAAALIESLLSQEKLSAEALSLSLRVAYESRNTILMDRLLSRPETIASRNGIVLLEAAKTAVARGEADKGEKFAQKAARAGARLEQVAFFQTMARIMAGDVGVTDSAINLINDSDQPLKVRLVVLYALAILLNRAEQHDNLNRVAAILERIARDNPQEQLVDDALLALAVQAADALPSAPYEIVSAIVGFDASKGIGVRPQQYARLARSFLWSDPETAARIVAAGIAHWSDDPVLNAFDIVLLARDPAQHDGALRRLADLIQVDLGAETLALIVRLIRIETPLSSDTQALENLLVRIRSSLEYRSSVPLIGVFSELLISRGRPSDALSLINEALREELESPGILLRSKALALQAQGEVDSAVDSYMRALEVAEDDTKLKRLVALDFKALGRLDLAQEVVADLITEEHNYGSLLLMGDLKFDAEEDLVQAKHYWQLALEAQETSAVHTRLGQLAAYFELDYESAVQHFDASLTVQPQRVDRLEAARFFLEISGDMDKAERALAGYAADDDVDMAILRAHLLVLQDRVDEAERTLLARGDFFTNPALLIGFARVFFSIAGKETLSRTFADRALRDIHDQNKALLSNASAFYRSQVRDLDTAEAIYRRLIDGPEGIKAQSVIANLAQLELARGDVKKGLERLRRLRDERPKLFPAVEVEVLFYLFIHDDPAMTFRWRDELTAALEEGARSPNWDFAPTLRWTSQLRIELLEEATQLAERVSLAPQEVGLTTP